VRGRQHINHASFDVQAQTPFSRWDVAGDLQLGCLRVLGYDARDQSGLCLWTVHCLTEQWSGAGIAAASRVKKSCLVLCTNSVSVDQWKYQFQLWSSLDSRDVSRFTSQQKEAFTGVANVCITTYTMIAYSGRRSEESAKVRGQTRHQHSPAA